MVSGRLLFVLDKELGLSTGSGRLWVVSFNIK